MGSYGFQNFYNICKFLFKDCKNFHNSDLVDKKNIINHYQYQK